MPDGWRMALLVGCGAGVLWWLAGRATSDRRLRYVVLGSFVARLLVAVVLYVSSYWRWPLLSALQLKNGFWVFGLDSRAYDYFARVVVENWIKGIELPKPEIAFEYIAFVAGWYRLLSTHPLYPIAVNCWLGAFNGLLAYFIGRKLVAHRAALLGAILVSFWPSSLLWSSQLLKDPLSWSLLLTTLLLVLHVGSIGALRHRWRLGRWIVSMIALCAVVIVLTRVRFYLGSVVSFAAIATFLFVIATAWKQRQFLSIWQYGGIALIVVGSTLFARTLDVFTLVSPAHPERGHFRLALQYQQEGRLLAAENAFSRAIALDRDYRDAYLGRAAVQVQQGKLDKALQGYISYLEHEDPQRRSLIKKLIARIYADQGALDFKQGKLIEAVAAFERALLFESSTELYANLGIILGQQHQFESAYATLAKALSAAQTPEEQARIRAERERILIQQERMGIAEQEQLLAQGSVAQTSTTTEPPHLLPLPETNLVGLAMTAFSLEPEEESGAWSSQVETLARSASQINEQALMTASEATPETLDAWRHGFVVTGGHSLMDPMAMISSPGQLFRYMPRALTIGFLAPFPRQWFDIRGSTGIMRSFAGAEMALWYFLLLCVARGTWRLLKRSQFHPERIFFLTTILALAISISLVVANVGTLFRLRLMFLLPLLIVAAAGDPRTIIQRMACRLLVREPRTFAAGPVAAINGRAGLASPLVSVVIPAYNASGTVDAAIHSVLHQTYSPVEVIIVDDGSTDDTGVRVRTWGDRVRYIRQAQAGPGAARNRGIAEARGEYVAFLDADDIWLPSKLEHQAAVLQCEPTIDAVQSSAYLVNDLLEVLEVRRCRQDRDTYLDALLFRNLPALASTLLARKHCLEAIGGFSTDREEVWDFACRLLRCHRLRSLPECLVLYRQHAHNRSHDLEIFRDSGVRTLQRAFADPALPPPIRRRETKIWARFYAMLAGGYFRHGCWNKSLQWGWRALVVSPSVIGYLAGLPLRRLERALTTRQHRSLATHVSSMGVASAASDQTATSPCASSF